MANRRNFVRAVKVEIIRRATRPDGQPACEHCGAIGVKLDFHHKQMDAMVLDQDKKRKLTADEGELLCRHCHDPITAGQRKVLAKASATEAKHIGANSAPQRPLESRDNLPKGRNPRHERAPLAPKQLYEVI